ncbi:MAG: hypothetical protein V4540_12850 [Pseudomonadota bacterium]
MTKLQRLRPTMVSDLDFMTSVEHDPANRPFVTPWDRTQHEGAIRSRACAPTTVATGWS